MHTTQRVADYASPSSLHATAPHAQRTVFRLHRELPDTLREAESSHAKEEAPKIHRGIRAALHSSTAGTSQVKQTPARPELAAHHARPAPPSIYVFHALHTFAVLCCAVRSVLCLCTADASVAPSDGAVTKLAVVSSTLISFTIISLAVRLALRPAPEYHHEE